MCLWLLQSGTQHVLTARTLSCQELLWAAAPRPSAVPALAAGPATEVHRVGRYLLSCSLYALASTLTFAIMM
jgi:hypothetical protein